MDWSHCMATKCLASRCSASTPAASPTAIASRARRTFRSTAPTNTKRRLENEGRVIADFDKRRREIARQLSEKAQALKSSLGPDADYVPLLDEVTALVEYPDGLHRRVRTWFPGRSAGMPDPDDAPEPEVLSPVRRERQADQQLPHCLQHAARQLEEHRRGQPACGQAAARGRALFLRDRQEDEAGGSGARNCATSSITTSSAASSTGSSVFARWRESLPRNIGADPELADRAALLAKADLVTNMVGEFPELQGIMGRYYALADGEDPKVAVAIERPLQPSLRRRSNCRAIDVSCGSCAWRTSWKRWSACLGIGQQPTGDKDPFALRRHALGVIRCSLEILAGGIDIVAAECTRVANCRALLEQSSAKLYKPGALRQRHRSSDLQISSTNAIATSYLRDRAIQRNEVDAVLTLHPAHSIKSPRALAAVRAFASLPEAAEPCRSEQARRSISSRRRKPTAIASSAEADCMTEPAEISLGRMSSKKSARIVAARFAAGRLYRIPESAWHSAEIRRSMPFSNDVMVMVDDRRVAPQPACATARSARPNEPGRRHLEAGGMSDMSSQVQSASRLAPRACRS